jgi:hypothetical protein
MAGLKESARDADVRPGPGVRQEILIAPDGSVDFPWIAPDATPLVLELWREHAGGKDFPVKVIQGKIFCG